MLDKYIFPVKEKTKGCRKLFQLVKGSKEENKIAKLIANGMPILDAVCKVRKVKKVLLFEEE